MNADSIVLELNAEIARLTQARDLLASNTSSVVHSMSASGHKVTRAPRKAAKKRSGMTPEGRKRIAEMMKKRWADKRAAAKKSSK